MVTARKAYLRPARGPPPRPPWRTPPRRPPSPARRCDWLLLLRRYPPPRSHEPRSQSNKVLRAHSGRHKLCAVHIALTMTLITNVRIQGRHLGRSRVALLGNNEPKVLTVFTNHWISGSLNRHVRALPSDVALVRTRRHKRKRKRVNRYRAQRLIIYFYIWIVPILLSVPVLYRGTRWRSETIQKC